MRPRFKQVKDTFTPETACVMGETGRCYVLVTFDRNFINYNRQSHTVDTQFYLGFWVNTQVSEAKNSIALGQNLFLCITNYNICADAPFLMSFVA